jgi:hypothetical protein
MMRITEASLQKVLINAVSGTRYEKTYPIRLPGRCDTRYDNPRKGPENLPYRPDTIPDTKPNIVSAYRGVPALRTGTRYDGMGRDKSPMEVLASPLWPGAPQKLPLIPRLCGAGTSWPLRSTPWSTCILSTLTSSRSRRPARQSPTPSLFPRGRIIASSQAACGNRLVSP